jgi:hypothetical protein
MLLLGPNFKGYILSKAIYSWLLLLFQALHLVSQLEFISPSSVCVANFDISLHVSVFSAVCQGIMSLEGEVLVKWSLLTVTVAWGSYAIYDNNQQCGWPLPLIFSCVEN